MPQTTISLLPDRAQEGLATQIEHAVSAAVETVAGVGPGRMLLAGAVEDGAIIPAGGLVAPLGFTILRSSDVEGGASVMFARYSGVSLLRRGTIWLRCVDAVAKGVKPYIQHTTADAGRPQTAATTGVQVDGIVCIVGAGAGELGKFEVNLP